MTTTPPDDPARIPAPGVDPEVDRKLPATTPEKPPHPLDGQWYLHLDGQSWGPYDGHALKGYLAEGRIGPDTSVARVGSQDWTRLSDDRVLRDLLRAHQAIPGVPPVPTGTVSTGNGGTIVQIHQHAPPPIAHYAAAAGDIGPKSPGLALFLSFLFAGLGQIYNGEIAKGIVMLVLTILLWLVLLGWIIWIWSMIDAYGGAKRLNIAANANLWRQ
ncbi:MAG: DUF4339 domain-containing protein [Salinarimonas sp.]|nr:DUF4339 domain-containing protein [Salinarimonas sp.]